MRNRRQNGSFNYYGSSLGYGPPRPLGMVPLPLAPLSSVSSISPYYVHETSGYSIRPPPFDQFLCDDVFPRPDIDETALTQILLNRHQELTPTAAEQSAIQNLITKVSQILDKIVSNPESFTPVSIEEVREVGSFKKGTMLANQNIGDIVVILKSLPTLESVNALGQKIVQDLKADQKEIFGCVPREYGCEIAGTQAVVRLLITILPQNAKMLEPDLHLAEKILQSNMATIRHVRWFEEHATHSSVKVLIRIIKDIKKRIDGFKALNVWCIELLAHYCIVQTRNRSPLSLASAFKRFFQILASGMLLPTSPAFVDPCDPSSRINYSLSYEEMDLICSTAQTLLRVILHGGEESVLGNTQTPINVTGDLTVWNNVVVTPLEKAYTAGDMEPYYAEEENVEMDGATVVKPEVKLFA